MNTELSTKPLLSIKEFAEYMGISETVSRDLLKKNPYMGITITVGNREFIVREKLNQYINKCATYGLAFGTEIPYNERDLIHKLEKEQGNREYKRLCEKHKVPIGTIFYGNTPLTSKQKCKEVKEKYGLENTWDMVSNEYYEKLPEFDEEPFK